MAAIAESVSAAALRIKVHFRVALDRFDFGEHCGRLKLQRAKSRIDAIEDARRDVCGAGQPDDAGAELLREVAHAVGQFSEAATAKLVQLVA
jgi:hypothetical protein